MSDRLLVVLAAIALLLAAGCSGQRIARDNRDPHWGDSLPIETVFQWLGTMTHRHYVLDPQLEGCRVLVPSAILHDPERLLAVIARDYAVQYDQLVEDGTTRVVPQENSGFYERYREPQGSGAHITL